MHEKRSQKVAEKILRHPAVQRLRSAAEETSCPPVYLVGGALRDGWLGVEMRDFDLVVHGEALPAASRIADALHARCVLMHEDWGVARLIHSPAGDKRSEVTFDFAPMRGEAIEEDLLQRDFTCNALALRIDPSAGPEAATVLDPTGGRKDLRSRLVRMVHPARLREDPLRLLRAFRLACTLDFRIERLTFDSIRAARQGILHVAAERTRDELFKILACPNSLECLLQMDEAGLLTTLFPDLEGLKGLKQGRFHHLDAWNHTLEAYRILEQGLQKGFEQTAAWAGEMNRWRGNAEEDLLPLLKTAILFHDAGKPATYSADADGEPHFYGHAARGALIAQSTMRRLRTSRHAEERVGKWVRYHMGPNHMMRAMETGHLSEKAKIRFLRKVGPDAPGMLLLSLADFLATAGPSATGARRQAFGRLLDSLLELYFRRDAASVEGQNLVTGKDLIEDLGITPGPVVGRLLRLLEEARVEGKVGNREEAIRLARSLLLRTTQGNSVPPKEKSDA